MNPNHAGLTVCRWLRGALVPTLKKKLPKRERRRSERLDSAASWPIFPTRWLTFLVPSAGHTETQNLRTVRTRTDAHHIEPRTKILHAAPLRCKILPAANVFIISATLKAANTTQANLMRWRWRRCSRFQTSSLFQHASFNTPNLHTTRQTTKTLLGVFRAIGVPHYLVLKALSVSRHTNPALFDPRTYWQWRLSVRAKTMQRTHRWVVHERNITKSGPIRSDLRSFYCP